MKWEYLIVHQASLSDLNKLGSLGWELVTVSHSPSGSTYAYYLKRPINV